MIETKRLDSLTPVYFAPSTCRSFCIACIGGTVFLQSTICATTPKELLYSSPFVRCGGWQMENRKYLLACV